MVAAAVRFRAAYAPPPRQMHKPAGTRSQKFVWQTHTADDTTRYDIDVREAHALLGTEPNDTLMRVKLNYLLRCRMFHPEVGGNAAMFYKISVAYERILFDRGVECRHGRIAHSDTLGPRARFDERPLLTDDQKAMLAAQCEALETTSDGSVVPWAEKAIQWHDPQSEMPPEALLAQQAFHDHQYKIGADQTDKQAQGYQHGAEKAALTIERLENELRELDSTGASKAEGTPLGALLASHAKAHLQDGAASSPLLAAKDGGGAVTIIDSSSSVQPAADGATAIATVAEPTTETDVALHPDGGVVTIKKPKRALFNQVSLSHWTDAELMRRWGTAGERLTHDEEEATAREIIERNINDSGGQLSKEQTKFMMNHLVERSDSVAGEAARSATDAMWHVEERKTVIREGAVLGCLVVLLFGITAMTAMEYNHYKKKEAKNPQLQEHINADTMLPWWGNDAEYEKQVKRLFVEEYRRGRSSARRVQTFQDGVARESMAPEMRAHLDESIFEVTSQRLEELRARAVRTKSATDDGIVSQDAFSSVVPKTSAVA